MYCIIYTVAAKCFNVLFDLEFHVFSLSKAFLAEKGNSSQVLFVSDMSEKHASAR